MLTEEQRNVFKEIGGKIKKDFGNKVYLRYRMLAYYFNEMLTKERGDKFYNIMKSNENLYSFFISLHEYKNGKSRYKFIKDMIIKVDGFDDKEIYLRTSDFFRFFKI